MANQDIIWVVVNAEDTQGVANDINAAGAKELCDVRIKYQADMMYPDLRNADKVKPLDRIVMHQGGARHLGGQLLRAAGTIKSFPRRLTKSDVISLPELWEVTRRWYKKFPQSPQNIKDEQIIFYNLKEPNNPMRSPKAIRPCPGDKFIDIHKNCQKHERCAAYDFLDKFWHKLMADL